MSHTGCVIHPSSSPGLIRIFTTGFVLREKEELLFSGPGRCDKVEDEIQQRFIPFILEDEEDRSKKRRGKKRKNCLNPPTGEMVLFDIEKFDADCFQGYDWNILKMKIPSLWRQRWSEQTGNKIEDFDKAFDFKYMSRRMRRLPRRHFLTKIFDHWDHFDSETVECLLESQNCERYGLRRPIKIRHKDLGENCRGSSRVSSYTWYYPSYCSEQSIDPANVYQHGDRIQDITLDLDADLAINGVHMMPDDDELPLEDLA